MKKHKKTKPLPEASKPLHEPEPDAAGIDLGATEIWVAATGMAIIEAILKGERDPLG